MVRIDTRPTDPKMSPSSHRKSQTILALHGMLNLAFLSFESILARKYIAVTKSIVKFKKYVIVL